MKDHSKRLVLALVVVSMLGCEGGPTSPTRVPKPPESEWTEDQRAAVANDPRPVGERLVDVGISAYLFPED